MTIETDRFEIIEDVRHELFIFLKFNRFVGDEHHTIVSDRQGLRVLLVFFSYAEVLQ